MTQFQLGSISTGTLRTEDLAPVFIEELLSRGVDAGDVPEDMDGLYNALESFCPPFVYFGTLEGDGADFGFWVDMNDFDESRRLDGNYQGNPEEVWHVAENVISHVSDHGNVTVMDMERNVLWSVV